MQFKLSGKYSKHIGLIASMLGLEHQVSLEKLDIDQPDDIKSYYKQIFESAKTMVQISRDEDHFLSFCPKQQEEVTNTQYNEEVIPIPIPVHLDSSIQESETTFYSLLAENNIIKHLFPFSEDTIRTTIQHFYNRKSTIAEVAFHAHNPSYQNNTFFWMIILCFCPEGRTNKHHNRLLHEGKENPYPDKRVAVMLCGHVRKVLSYIERQHLLFKYPHVDVFIHTWDDHGLKNHKHHKGAWLVDNSSKINVDFIMKQYSPTAICVEDNAKILPSLSLVGKMNPIYLYNGQAHDDATKYINSQLYSINKCFELVKEHEKKCGFLYDGIMKFRFDYIPLFFDMDMIMNNIEEDTLWFPHARHNHHGHFGGGGGCKCCDSGIEHFEHKNDLCDIWYYGKRDLMEKACMLYHEAPSILEKHTESNTKIVAELNIKTLKKDPFVFVLSTANIENHVVCYYPERLLREHLRDIRCKSCDSIRGGIV